MSPECLKETVHVIQKNENKAFDDHGGSHRLVVEFMAWIEANALIASISCTGNIVMICGDICQIRLNFKEKKN